MPITENQRPDVRPILRAGDPRLAAPAPPVTSAGPELTRAIDQLAATLAAARDAHGFGRALAAPQLGLPVRVVVVDLGAGPFALVNPELTWRSPERVELWDDCFSLPDQLVRVRRHRSVSVTYLDAQLRPRRWAQLAPDLAELIQHELDHLDGVLMTARAVGDDPIRPADQRARLIDAARPRHRLSLDRIAEAPRHIDRVFLDSPQYLCEPLADRLGHPVTLKVETINPIRSFKGRGAGLYVAGLSEPTPAGLVCASAGNFGQGLAYACRRRGIPLVVYVPTAANPLKLARMRALGAEVRLHGADLDDAADAARGWAAATGARLVVDGLEPSIAEGAGTIARELFADDPAHAAVYVPVGDGALIGGMARWIKARSPATQVIGVGSRGAPAMAEAFHARGVVGVAGAPRTIADGIAVRTPSAAAVADLVSLVDDVVLVDDAALIEAMRLLHACAGLVVEPAGAAGLAALLSFPASADADVATVVCGGNVTPAQARGWLGLTD